MPTVKTAISLDQELLDRIDEVARELAVPRSRLLAEAATQFLERRDDARLLAALNAAYGAAPSAEERTLELAHRQAHRRMLEPGG